MTAAVLRTERVRIGYADTDAAGIIYYAAWFPWMERLHTNWLFENGLPLPDLPQRSENIIVTRATSCEYLAVVRPLDGIDIVMRLGRVGPRSYQLEYEMTRVGDEVVVARSTMTLAGVDRTGRSAALPELITGLFPARTELTEGVLG